MKKIVIFNGSPRKDGNNSTILNLIERGAKEAGVKRIRLHDLRHSHVSLLIELGFSALAIAERVGHESIHITYKIQIIF